jgi:RHS repeat-associated protein
LYDAETGLYYNYFRHYDPKTGTYPQPDPIGLQGGINTYSYVGGNPVNFIDPLGLDVCAVNGMLETCSTGQRPPPEGTPTTGPLSPMVGPLGAAAAADATSMCLAPEVRAASAASKVIEKILRTTRAGEKEFESPDLTVRLSI